MLIGGIGVFVFGSWVLGLVLGIGGHVIAIQTDKSPFAGQPTNHRVNLRNCGIWVFVFFWSWLGFRG